MPIWSGFDNGCFWNWTHGKFTQEMWEATVNKCVESTISTKGKLCMLSVVYQAPVPTAAQRGYMSSRMNELHEYKPNVFGHALATDSRLVRCALTAFSWVIHKPFPEKVFDAPSSACAWLGSRAAGFDTGAVLEAIQRQLPAESVWSE